MTATVVTTDLKSLYSKEYDMVQDYQYWASIVRQANDDLDAQLEDGFTHSVRNTENPYWGSHVPFSVQVTHALRHGYYEALLTNQIDGERFNLSSYYRLGQILGTMASKGIIPHDSWKDIVWAVDDLTGFNKSLPLGVETLRIAKDIVEQITGEPVVLN